MDWTLSLSEAAAQRDAAPRREHFIPLRKAHLLDLLVEDARLSLQQQSDLRRLSHLLEAMFHLQYQSELETIKTAYAPFDPDSDTVVEKITADERARRLKTLSERFDWLMRRANFVRLERSDIEAALSGNSNWGLNLRVDFDVFEHLEIYARGDIMGKRTLRRWSTLWRPRDMDVAIYQRLAVFFRLRPGKRVGANVDTDSVYVKSFKDIPKLDLEMLLPGTRVRMSQFDQLRIVLPTISGIGLVVWKAIQGALVAAAVGAYSTLALVGGTMGYGAKSFWGYLRTKQKYQFNLTQSLYYQSLDNNAGVFCRLLDEAEEQENCEALLAYFLLWRHTAEGLTSDELDQQAEVLLERFVGRSIDFEVDDALDKLHRLGLLYTKGDGRFRAVPMEHTLERLASCWQTLARPAVA